MRGGAVLVQAYVKQRGSKYWRKRQTCDENNAAVEDTEYGGRVPFPGCSGSLVTSTFTIQGWTYLMGDEKESEAVATRIADADI